MCKRKIILISLLLFVLTVVLAGCKKNVFSVVVSNDLNVEITAQNASKGSFAAAGTIQAEEGHKIVVEPTLKKGEITIKFTSSDLGMDASVNELNNAVKGENAVLEFTVIGKEPQEYDIEPGSYMISAEVLSKSDGIIVISVK